MVSSCTMSSNCFWLWHLAANNILLMRKRTHAFLLVWKWQIALLSEDIHVDQMIKQLLFNSVITTYRDLSLSSLWTDPPPLRKNQRRDVCDSPLLIVYGNNFTLKWKKIVSVDQKFCGSCFMSFQFSKCWCMSPTYFHRATERERDF